MAQVNSQDGAQPEMLPEGYPVGDEQPRQMQAQQRGRTVESPAPDLSPDRESPSRITYVLRGGELLLSLTAVFLGAGGLIMGISMFVTSSRDNYDYYTLGWGIMAGVVLLLPGIFWLKSCIRRIRVLRASIPGSKVVLNLTASCMFLVLLMALMAQARAAKPVNVVHFRLQYLAGRRSFQDIELQEAKLSGADLFGARLSGADPSGADLGGADLAKANLSGADLSRARLSGADLLGAWLSQANLRGTDLSNARLFQADLTGADLNGAKLYRADLSRANLQDADLSEADLSGADLSKAKVSDAQLAQAACLEGATLPDGSVHE